jgi:hypothetical protein
MVLWINERPPTEAALVLAPTNVVAVCAFEHAMRLAVAAIQHGDGVKTAATACTGKAWVRRQWRCLFPF